MNSPNNLHLTIKAVFHFGQWIDILVLPNVMANILCKKRLKRYQVKFNYCFNDVVETGICVIKMVIYKGWPKDWLPLLYFRQQRGLVM